MAGDTSGNRGNVGTGNPRGENGWQGEDRFTPEGRARATEQLERHRPAHLTHGLGPFLTRAVAPPCDKCIVGAGKKGDGTCDRYREGATCALAEEYQAEVAAQIMALPHIEPVDRSLVLEFAKVQTAISILDRYLAHTGPLLPGSEQGLLEYQPAMKTRLELSGRLEKLAGSLSLTPLQRAKLAAKQGGPGSDLAAAHAALQAEAIEGEFTTDADAGEQGDR